MNRNECKILHHPANEQNDRHTLVTLSCSRQNEEFSGAVRVKHMHPAKAPKYVYSNSTDKYRVAYIYFGALAGCIFLTLTVLPNIIFAVWIPFVELSCCGMGGGPAERISQVPIKGSSDETYRRGVSPRTVGRQYLPTPGSITTRSMATAGSQAVGPEPLAALSITARMPKAAEGLRAASTRAMATPSPHVSNGLKVTRSLRSRKWTKATSSDASKMTFRVPSLQAARMYYYKRRAAQIESMVNGIGVRKQGQVGGRDTVPPPERVEPTGTAPGFVAASIGGKTKKKRTTVGNGTTVRHTRDEGLVIGDKKPGDDAKYRYTFPDPNQRKTRRRGRITASRISFENNCDYLIYYCLKTYNTGTLCGRTVYYKYKTFKNYCVMDYVNCMERYELWLIVHTGACIEEFQELGWYEPYPYMDDYFMDQMYVLEF